MGFRWASEKPLINEIKELRKSPDPDWGVKNSFSAAC
jgi:hypothetical protein